MSTAPIRKKRSALHRQSSKADQRIQGAVQKLRSSMRDEPLADFLEGVARLESSDSPDAFTEAQEDVLTEAGMPALEARPLEGPRIRAGAEKMQLLSEAYTTTQAAEILAVTEGRVRQHTANRSLLAWKANGKAYYPRFQFTANGRIVPGWSSVAPHFPRDVHPVAVEAFLHRVSEELEVGERNVSPLEWLSTGGDPDAVANLVANAYQIT